MAPPLLDDLRRGVATVPGLTLLVLHGSRARGDARVDSDWDFASLGASATLDLDALIAVLAKVTHANRIDLVDLARAGALLRHRAARDGLVVFERDPETFLRFWIDAVGTWCDLEPVLTPAYEHVLRDVAEMSPLDRAVLADRAMALRRHLARVADKLPAQVDDFTASSDAADAVILHLWQATQSVIDLAVAACAVRQIGTPSGYADAFRLLQQAGVLDPGLADRLVRAAGLRNVVAHAYEKIDMVRVYRAAIDGPSDLLAFVGVLERLTVRDATSRQP
jgi:uncharacterized protein YutE (UPF0331/DUF86 family)/predicted nucleotidyltransferase